MKGYYEIEEQMLCDNGTCPSKAEFRDNKTAEFLCEDCLNEAVIVRVYESDEAPNGDITDAGPFVQRAIDDGWVEGLVLASQGYGPEDVKTSEL